MKILNNNNDLENFISQVEQQGQKIALVPTMGALHEGHLRLVERGQEEADICLPYIFVNPTQFAEGEDLDKYPRTLEADLQKLENIGIDTVWTPSVLDIYPEGPKADIHVDGITQYLEGEFRPHFFDGVTTVLNRMFRLSRPYKVMMGEKDFQQLQVTRQMVRQLKLPIEIIGVPTVRDKNGLALSSRNQYLSESDYEIAIQLNHILVQLAQNMITEQEAVNLLLDSGFDKVDYCVQRNSETFESENPNRVLAAAWIGQTRLIDNMAM